MSGTGQRLEATSSNPLTQLLQTIHSKLVESKDEALQDKIASLQKSLETQIAVQKANEQTQKAQQKQIALLRNQVDSAQQTDELNQIKDKLDQLESLSKAAKAQPIAQPDAEITKQLEALKAEYTSMKRGLDLSAKVNGSLRAQLQEVITQTDLQIKEINTWQAEYQERSIKDRALQEEQSTLLQTELTQTKQAVNKRFAMLEKRVGGLESVVETMRGQLGEVKSDNEEMNAKVKTIQENLAKVLDEQQKAQKQQQQYQKQIASLRTQIGASSPEQINELQAHVEKLEAELKKLANNSNVTQTNEQLESLKQDYVSMKKGLELAAKNNTTLRQQLQASISENEKQITQIAEWQTNLAKKMEEEQKAQSAVIEDLQVELAQTKSGLTKKIAEFDVKIRELKTEQDEMKKEITKLDPEIQIKLSVDSKLEDLKKKMLENKEIEKELEIYIPVRGAYRIQDPESFDLETKAREILKSDKKLLLLLGNAGGGKSTFNLFLARKLWKEHKTSDRIPLFISLPSLHDPETNLLGEYFKQHGFTDPEIIKLKQSYSFIFILDGYDEINKFKNLYIGNHLDQWDAKVLISCRTDYLAKLRDKDYTQFFQPYKDGKLQQGAFQELTVVPFNDSQIEDYVKKYLASHPKADWNDPNVYLNHIKTIPGLRKLIETPFMLMLAMDVMPRIVEKYADVSNDAERTKLTQAALYDEFIQQWFEREEDKLIAHNQLPDDGHNVIEDFWQFAMDLASEMHIREEFQPYYKPPKSDIFSRKSSHPSNDPSPWAMFFSPHADPDIVRARRACPLKEVGDNRRAFIHGSLVPYFSTRKMYLKQMDEIEAQTQAQQKTQKI